MLGTSWILVTLGVVFVISMATGGSGISWFGGGVVGMAVWSVAAPFGILPWYGLAIGYALVLMPLGLFFTGKLGVR